jgi:zinc protease
MATHDGVTRTVLANGLTVLIEPMHHAPVVALQAWVHVGGADEDKEREAGLAHLHEHMLFKGTTKRAVGEVARCVEAAGGEINAWTSFDETVYHLVLGQGACDLGLDLLADVLMHSTFDADELSKEIEVVLEEIRRAEDSPSRRHMMALFRTAFAAHPYRQPVLGTAKSVAATTQERMLAFFHGHYRPDNTTLVIAGDVTVDALLPRIEHHFGAWQPHSGSTPVARKMPRPTEPPLPALAAQVLAEDVQEARLTLAWHSAAVQHPNTPALDLFAIMLGQGEASRLHKELVRPRLVLDAYASNYTPKDMGLFLLGATLEAPRPEGDAVLSVARALVSECVRMAQGAFTQEELETARTLALADEAFSRQTMEGQARKRGFFDSTAGDYLFERSHMAGLREATRDDIRKAALAMLEGHPAVVLQLPQDAPRGAIELTAADFAAAVAQAQQEAQQSVHKLAQRRGDSRHGVYKVQLEQGPLLLVQPEPSGVTAVRAINLGGLRSETPEHGGLAMLMAHSWSQSTQGLSAQALAQKIADAGGSLSGFSGRNTVGLSGEWLSSHHADGFALFLETLWAPEFASEDVLRERHAIAERLRAREDSPGGVAMDLFLASLYPSHPYGFCAMGSMDSLARLTHEEVRAYHHKHVDPSTMVLSVVGPVDVDAVAQQVMAAVEPLRRATTTAAMAVPPQDPPPSAYRRVHRPLAKQQAHVILGSMGLTFEHADRYALEVLCAVLSGQSGRLFGDLRDRQSLAYSLSCGSAEGLEPGHVLVHMACAFDKVSRACDGVMGHLQRLIDVPVTPQELARAQQMLIGSHAIDLQRPGARAMTYATQELYGLGFDHHLHAAARIEAVTAPKIREVAAAHFAADRLIEVVVGPGDDAGAA